MELVVCVIVGSLMKMCGKAAVVVRGGDGAGKAGGQREKFWASNAGGERARGGLWDEIWGFEMGLVWKVW